METLSGTIPSAGNLMKKLKNKMCISQKLAQKRRNTSRNWMIMGQVSVRKCLVQIYSAEPRRKSFIQDNKIFVPSLANEHIHYKSTIF